MNIFFKKTIPHVVAVILFFAATYIYFSPLLYDKGVAQHDIEQFRGSAKEIVDHRAEFEEEPLWTNSMFGGMPAYLISTVYKGNLLVKVDKVLQLAKQPAGFIFFTLVGFYILLIVLGVNPWLSIVGAFAYGLSSYFFIVIAAGHNAKIHAISYVAPMIAGIFLAFRGKYIGGFALFALFLGLNLNAGHLQITYYAGFIMLALGIAFFVKAIKEKTVLRFSKGVGVLLLALMLAVGANFSRLYFSWESGKYSIRGASELTSQEKDRTSGLDKEYATAWSYGVAETFNLLIPNLMGGASAADFGPDSHTYKFLKQNGVPPSQARSMVSQMPAYWGPQPMTSGPVYIGAIVIFLFALSMFVIDDKLKWYLLGVTLLTIMLAWGRNFMPLTDFFLDYFPGYNKFRTVSMILYVAEFTMPLLAFLGLREIFNGKVSKERFMNGFKWSLGIVAGLCLIFIVLGGSLFSFQADIDSRYIASGFPAEMFDAVRLDRQSMMRADAFRSLVFVLLTGGAVLLFYLKKIKPAYFIGLLGVLVIADMWTVDKRYLSDDNFVPKSKVTNPFVASSADRQILADTTTYFRVYNRAVSTFNDASTSYYHKSIGGYHGAKLRRFQELIDYHISRNNPAVLNMLNTRYLIDEGPIARYNPGALGNAWFVNSALIVGSADEEIVALDNFKPLETAIVNRDFAEELEQYNTPASLGDTIYLADYRANRLVYNYTLSEPRLAVFSDIYYPKGWVSTVNGEEIEHIRANYVLRAMLLPAGSNEVVFEFKPKMFAIGYRIDMAASLLIILAALGWVGKGLFEEWSRKN